MRSSAALNSRCVLIRFAGEKMCTNLVGAGRGREDPRSVFEAVVYEATAERKKGPTTLVAEGSSYVRGQVCVEAPWWCCMHCRKGGGA